MQHSQTIRTHKANRWQKHGEDRIYVSGAKDGSYIDLKAGEVVGELEPETNAMVEAFEMDFDTETETITIEAHAPNTLKASAEGDEWVTAVEIPANKFGYAN